VQEGDTPAEEPRLLLEEIERLTEMLTVLIKRINRTNAAAEFAPGRRSRLRWPNAI